MIYEILPLFKAIRSVASVSGIVQASFMPQAWQGVPGERRGPGGGAPRHPSEWRYHAARADSPMQDAHLDALTKLDKETANCTKLISTFFLNRGVANLWERGGGFTPNLLILEKNERT